jgi:thiamine-monophosphate kinase
MSEIPTEDAWLAGALRDLARAPGTVLGIGHDVAAVRLASDRVAVLAKDVIVDGTHFHLDACGPRAAARKALAVNVSDLAAAASVPVAFLLGLVLPRPARRDLFDGLMAGFADAAREMDCALIGGDTNVADGPLVLSVTVLGRPGPMGVLSRAGARVGDVLSVTGPLGGSGHGRHLTFRPRVAEALALAAAGVPRAMMDVSDGLSRDLPRLCRASEVGALLEGDAVPVHPDVGAPAGSRAALDRALDDGEDFELLLAHAPLSPRVAADLAARGVRLVRIGTTRPAAEGVRLRWEGSSEPLEARGWDHLAT